MLVEVAVDSLLALTNLAFTDSLFLSAVLSDVSDSTLELSAKSPLPEKLTRVYINIFRLATCIFIWKNSQEVFILVPTPVAMLGAGPFSFSGLLSEGPAEIFCGSSDFSPTAIFYRLIQNQDDLSKSGFTIRHYYDDSSLNYWLCLKTEEIED